jgi:hypothetical protein
MEMSHTMEMHQNDEETATVHEYLRGPAHGADLAELLERLPIDAIHELDEELAADSLPDGGTALVAELVAAIDATTWPEDVAPQIAELRANAVALADALAAADTATATDLAEKVHGGIHLLEVGSGDH